MISVLARLYVKSMRRHNWAQIDWVGASWRLDIISNDSRQKEKFVKKSDNLCSVFVPFPQKYIFKWSDCREQFFKVNEWKIKKEKKFYLHWRGCVHSPLTHYHFWCQNLCILIKKKAQRDKWNEWDRDTRYPDRDTGANDTDKTPTLSWVHGLLSLCSAHTISPNGKCMPPSHKHNLRCLLH